jgi:hypothetical protein
MLETIFMHIVISLDISYLQVFICIYVSVEDQKNYFLKFTQSI